LSTSKRRRGAFFFAFDPNVAATFGDSDSTADYEAGYNATVVMPVYISLQNPFDPSVKGNLEALIRYLKDYPHIAARVDKYIDGGLWDLVKKADWAVFEAPDVRAWLKAAGFDGYYCTEGGHTLRTIAVFKPSQIKSVYNAGTWDPEDPDIRRNPRLTRTEARGSGGVRRFNYYDGATRVGTARMMGDTIGDIEVAPRHRRKGYGLAILGDLLASGGRSAYAGSQAGARLMAAAGMIEDEEGHFIAP
jgi:hypothetical protein